MGVTLGEAMRRAAATGEGLDEAARALGHAPGPRPPVPDGYVVPPHALVLTAEAEARAARHGRAAAMAAIEAEIESLMVDRVRDGRDGSRFGFAYDVAPSPAGALLDGYVLVPRGDAAGTIDVDAARMVPVGGDGPGDAEALAPDVGLG